MLRTYIVIGFASILGAIIQATMGFGSAMILLNVLPLFFPITKAVALMQASIIVLNLVFSFRYRKKIRWEILWPALIPASVLGLVFTLWSVTLDVSALSVALGVVFIILSIYELAFSGNIRVRPSKTTGFLMGAFSGIGNAFFSLAEPPVAMHLVPSIDDNIE